MERLGENFGKRLLFRRWMAAAVVIPLNLAQWEYIPLRSGDMMPKWSQTPQSTLEISTSNHAGGWIYRLKKPVDLTAQNATLSWEWNVSEYPKIQWPESSEASISKNDDDFALRIGLVFGGPKELVGMRGPFRDLVKKHDIKVSKVLFLLPTPQMSWDQKCTSSPYVFGIEYCFRKVDQKWKAETLDLGPFHQKQLAGFWIVADSDNTQSTSRAGLKNLKLNFGK